MKRNWRILSNAWGLKGMYVGEYNKHAEREEL
jgi:hypothetical protein